MISEGLSPKGFAIGDVCGIVCIRSASNLPGDFLENDTQSSISVSTEESEDDVDFFNLKDI